MKTEDYVLAHDIAGILDMINIPDRDHFVPSIQLALQLTRSIIRYFFICIEENGTDILCFILFKHDNNYISLIFFFQT